MAVVSGGTTLIDNGILDAAVPTGSLTLLSTQTASASATISFTSGIDSTYDSYLFKFYNIHPATNGASFKFQGSTDGGSTYGITSTTTAFRAAHSEGDATAFGYLTGQDQAQSTSDMFLINEIGNQDDQNCSGTLQLFSPSSSVFVKHFITRTQGNYHGGDYSLDFYTAGYFNDGANAINAIRFQFSSGNIDSGTIKMYGVK